MSAREKILHRTEEGYAAELQRERTATAARNAMTATVLCAICGRPAIRPIGKRSSNARVCSMTCFELKRAKEALSK